MFRFLPSSFQSSLRQSLRCAALLLTLPVLGAVSARADYTTTVQPTTSYGVWDGWGCSLAWWANVFGTRTDLAGTIFGVGTVSLTTNTGTYALHGLGLNIARYNVGGSGSGMSVPTTMPAWKQIPGYWLNWNSSDPASSSFNWYTDSNQRNALWNARNAGATLFEAFSDSPMYWMCNSNSSAGSTTSGAEGLQSWNHAQSAVYLATVVKYAHDNWGINFTSVDPFNEPSAGWWNYSGASQEGCNIYTKTGTQQAVISALRTELNNRGMQGVGVAASDENSPDQALSTWNALDARTRGSISRINTHGYSGQSAYRGSNRGPLFSAVSAGGKKLWMSEYGEGDASGLTMAQSILLDLNQMHPSGWVYWQPLDSGGWGLIQSNPGDNWIGAPNPKYYVLAQFSRSIRPGMTILSSGDPNTVAAYDPAGHTLALVTLNGATGQWINYDLSHFSRAAGPITRWDTQTGGGDLYAQHNDTSLSGTKFWSWFSPNTVQTFVVQNVSL